MLSGIRRSFDKRFNTTFRKNLLILTSGNATAQLLGILSYPILTRLYPDEVFGQYALFNSIILLLGFAITLRYEVAIPLPKEDSEAEIIKKGSILISTIIALALLVIAFLIDHLRIYPEFDSYIYFIPLSAFITSLFQIFRFWHLRTNQLVHYFRVYVGYRFIYLGLACTTPFFFDFRNGLISSLIIATIVIIPIFLSAFRGAYFSDFNLSETKKVLSSHYRFPRFTLPSFLLAHATNQVPIFLLIYFFSESVTGQYSVAFNLLWIPQNMLLLRISESLYQNARDLDYREVRRLIYKIWLFLIPFMFLASIILYFFGKDLFLFFLGDQWTLAGEIASMLAILILVSSLHTPISSLVFLLNIQGISFNITIIRLVYTSIAFLVAGLYQDIFIGIKVLVTVGSIVGLALTWILMRTLSNRMGD